jgi:hypothetical protein
MTESPSLEHIRRDLVVAFTELPEAGDVMVWQRHLADAIIAAENNSGGYDVADLKYHRHLLRVIGDALVYALLPSHTIRTLSRHPGRPAALSAQGQDFEFVFSCATQLRARGFIPILADLTTLIGIGDIVGWGRGGILVLECKNRAAPERLNTSGRVARQRARGERAEEYLASSRVTENDGTVRTMYEFELPEPDWTAVEQLLLDCVASETRVALLLLGPDDILVACAEDMPTPDVLAAVMPDAGGLNLPVMANYAQLLDGANHRARAPSSYPIAADLCWRLLERKLSLFRLSDMGKLASDAVHDGLEVQLTPERIDGLFHVRVGVPEFESVSFSPSLVEYCLWMPVPVAGMRDALKAYAKLLVTNLAPRDGLGSAMPTAEGDHFAYATAYRNDGTTLSSLPGPISDQSVGTSATPHRGADEHIAEDRAE